MIGSHSPSRRWFYGLIALAILVLPGCGWDGHLDILGYTTRPNYDPAIRTVFVKIAGNMTYVKWLEADLTRYLIREIESKTPLKFTSDRSCADTELVCKITNEAKQLIIMNQNGEVRDAQMTLTVEVMWRDLRPGHEKELLSVPRPGRPTDPVPPGPPPQAGPPVIVQAMGRFTPEMGSSRTTAEQDMLQQVAVQVVSMMERPW